MNCSSLFLRSAPLALCVLLPSCEALDPALMGGGGGGGYRPAPYERQEPYRDNRGPDYSRQEVYRDNRGPVPDRRYTGEDRRDDRYTRPSSGRPDERSRSGNSRDADYYGGPEAWYKAGYALGKKDRSNHHSSDYRRHDTQYDRKTESQFASGYRAGYNR